MNISESCKKRLQELAGINWLPKFLYHFTPTKNVKSIMKKGLVPKYKPNREYYSDEFTSNAVYLTDTPLYDSANLPRNIDEEKSITILKIDTSFLDPKLFVVDDDYYEIYLKRDEGEYAKQGIDDESFKNPKISTSYCIFISSSPMKQNPPNTIALI
jgi:hypothetical protein